MVESLKDRIVDDMKSAMRAKDKGLLGTIRLLLSAIKQKEVDERVTLSDADIMAVINAMIKQRKESAKQYQAGGREDLVAQEESEILVLSAYLPEPLSEEEVSQILETVIAELGASSPKDMGQVMAALKDKVQGRADMSALSQQVKSRLN